MNDKRLLQKRLLQLAIEIIRSNPNLTHGQKGFVYCEHQCYDQAFNEFECGIIENDSNCILGLAILIDEHSKDLSDFSKLSAACYPVRRLLLDASNRGNSHSMVYIATMYAEGKYGFTKQDAILWLNKAIEAGHPSAKEMKEDLFPNKLKSVFKILKKRVQEAALEEGTDQLCDDIDNRFKFGK